MSSIPSLSGKLTALSPTFGRKADTGVENPWALATRLTGKDPKLARVAGDLFATAANSGSRKLRADAADVAVRAPKILNLSQAGLAASLARLMMPDNSLFTQFKAGLAALRSLPTLKAFAMMRQPLHFLASGLTAKGDRSMSFSFCANAMTDTAHQAFKTTIWNI